MLLIINCFAGCKSDNKVDEISEFNNDSVTITYEYIGIIDENVYNTQLYEDIDIYNGENEKLIAYRTTIKNNNDFTLLNIKRQRNFPDSFKMVGRHEFVDGKLDLDAHKEYETISFYSVSKSITDSEIKTLLEECMDEIIFEIDDNNTKKHLFGEWAPYQNGDEDPLSFLK